MNKIKINVDSKVELEKLKRKGYKGNKIYFNKKKGKLKLVHNKITKILLTAGLCVSVVSCSGLLNFNNSQSESNDLAYTTEVSSEYQSRNYEPIQIDYQSDNERVQTVLNCIEKNNILQNKSKADLVQTEKFFNDHVGLYSEESFKNICNRLEKLTISYQDTVPLSAKGDSARYVFDHNLVYMYENTYDNPEQANEILMHEIFHVLANNKGTYNTYDAIGYSINEGITEQLKSEYFGTEYQTYASEVLCVRLLSEIVDPNIILQAQLNGDNKILIDSLIEITGTEDDALKLLAEMDAMYDSEYVEETFLSLSEEEIQDIKVDILNDMNKYFVAKYKYDMSEDEIQSVYASTLLGDRTQIIKKGYFNQDYNNGETTLKHYNVTIDENKVRKSQLISQEIIENPTRESAIVM